MLTPVKSDVILQRVLTILCEQLGSFKEIRNTILRLKSVKSPVSHTGERRFRKFNTHRKYRNEEGRGETASNLPRDVNEKRL